MENASKALLIAGSVLIVLLLIAVGMKIFNSTANTTDSVEVTMATTEVAMFNNKFTPYLGDNKSVNEAISLLNIVMANNSTNSADKSIYIRLQKWASGTAIGTNAGESSYVLSQLISELNENRDKITQITVRATSGWTKEEGFRSGYDNNGYITDIHIAYYM